MTVTRILNNLKTAFWVASESLRRHLMGFYFRPSTFCSTEYEIPFLKTDKITANFAYFGKLAFDLYDLRANVSMNMADIEVGFVNVCEKFGMRALNDYQRETITQFVNNTNIAHWFSREIWAGSCFFLGGGGVGDARQLSATHMTFLLFNIQ